MSRCWIKRMAILLLVLAALDLGVPGFCQTDGIEFPSVQSHHGIVLEKMPAAHGGLALFEDDCFCCCSHIMHRQSFVLAVLSPMTLLDLQNSPSKPHQPGAPHFHPPRA
jgi:hypothetical protein